MVSISTAKIVRVAAHHLNKLVLAFDQRFVVDAAGVFFAEAVFAALGDEAAAVAGVLVVKFFLVLIAYRRAVDDHAGALDRFFGFEARLHAHVDEFLPALFVDGELRALVARDHDFGTVGEQRRALVKSHFVDAELAP